MTHHAAAPATCENTGTKEYYSCSICGKDFEDADGEQELTELTTPAIGHDWSAPEWTWAADHSSATATFTCENDPSHAQEEHADITLETTPATCTTKGKIIYTATVKFNRTDYTNTKEETIDATGHQWSDWTTVTEPTCTGEGEEKHKCNVCNTTETRAIKATGHDWEAGYTVDKEATCTEAGSESIHCSKCDETKENREIEALGHSFTNYISDNNATCSEDGTETATCDRCDATDTRTVEGSKLPHTYSKWSSDEKDHWKECDVCKLLDANIEIEQHEFEWITDKDC